MVSREDAVEIILSELSGAIKKFPKFPTDPVHAAGIVVEEAGELMKAALQFTYEKGLYNDLYDECMQVGAMALRFLMHVEEMKERQSEQVKTI